MLKAAYKIGGETITIDMLPSFKEGTYQDYTALLAAVKRRYQRGHTQETMMDWFRKIDESLTNKCPTEFKIQRLKTLLEPKFLTDPSKFPTCSDFEGDSVTQQYPEEFSPMIASLLHYITLSSEVPRSDWDKVQRLFYLEIKGKATYLSWHENRSELYRVIDEYKASTKSVNNVREDINLVRRGQFRPTRGRNNNTRPRPNQNQNFSQNQNVYRPPQRQNPNRQQQQQQQQPRRNQMNRQNTNQYSNQNRLRKLLCMHCSRCAGTNKYHQGPWGGGPASNCPYDKNGNKRAGYRFLASIYGEDVNNVSIEHYQDIDDDGLVYESPSLNQVSDTQNYLIAKAMGNHD